MLKFRKEIKIYVSMQLIDASGLCALVFDYFLIKHKDKFKILWWPYQWLFAFLNAPERSIVLI